MFLGSLKDFLFQVAIENESMLQDLHQAQKADAIQKTNILRGELFFGKHCKKTKFLGRNQKRKRIPRIINHRRSLNFDK